MKVHHSLALIITVMLTCVACSGTSDVNHRPSASSGVEETDSTQNIFEEQSSPQRESSSGTDVNAPFEALGQDINAVTNEAIVPQPERMDVSAIEEQPQSSTVASTPPADDVDTDVMTGVSLDPKPTELSVPSTVDTNAFTGEEVNPQPAEAPVLLPALIPELSPERVPELMPEPIPELSPERVPELSPEPMPELSPERVPEPVDTNAFTRVQLDPQPERGPFELAPFELMPVPESTDTISVDVADDALIQMPDDAHSADDALPNVSEDTHPSQILH